MAFDPHGVRAAIHFPFLLTLLQHLIKTVGGRDAVVTLRAVAAFVTAVTVMTVGMLMIWIPASVDATLAAGIATSWTVWLDRQDAL
jgi:hypothetical protein